MSSKPSPKKATTSKSVKSADDKPKRNRSAFCFYLRHRAGSMKSFSPDNMKLIRAEWNQLNAKQREPFERAAAEDTNRYLRQKEQWQSSRVKRPANAYVKFIQDFMTKNLANYANVRNAMSAGAAQWKGMSDQQKAPWQKLASDASKQYAAKKLTMAKSKPAVAKAKPGAAKAKPAGAVKSKLGAAKAGAKPKTSAAKAAKSTLSKIAGTRKSPKLIKKIKSKKTK